MYSNYQFCYYYVVTIYYFFIFLVNGLKLEFIISLDNL